MKKNIFYMIACGVMVLAAAACSKEQASTEPQEETAGLVTESLSAQKESEATKVTLDATTLNFGWSNKDKAAFSIYNDGTSSYDFVESGFYGTPIANKFTVSYTGTREGYAVIPSTFAKSLSADGNTLTVTYPTSYDISADVAAGCYDNGDGTHFIPFPMIAVSTYKEAGVEFHSIGALARVKISHIPAGTKYLYVTFNQTVTGDFTVTNPGTTTPSVTVSDSSTPSTVEIKISEAGLAAEVENIRLYIPVPTTSGLTILSADPSDPYNTKSTVARNYGYAWSVNAISREVTTTTFKKGSYDYYLAPGNLWAHNTGSGVEYFFPSGMDQLRTTCGAWSNDPHVNGDLVDAPSVATSGKYQDIFTFAELYKIMTGTPMADPTAAASLSGDCVLTINGDNHWRVATNYDYIGRFWAPASRDNSSKIYVHGRNNSLTAFVEVNVSGTDYAKYALYNTNYLSGRLVFPDGYIDMTDAISVSALTSLTGSCEITYSALEKMIDAGAFFILQGGNYYDGAYHVTATSGGTIIYSVKEAGTSVPYLNYSKGFLQSDTGHYNTYRTVRMYGWRAL